MLPAVRSSSLVAVRTLHNRCSVPRVVDDREKVGDFSKIIFIGLLFVQSSAPMTDAGYFFRYHRKGTALPRDPE